MDSGLAPVITTDPGSIRRLVERDGAAVLAGWDTSGDDAAATALAIFGADVLHTAGCEDDDASADYVLLGCAGTTPGRGESLLVDGDDVVARLGAHPAGGELLRRLQTVLVDHAEPGAPSSCSPVIGKTREGRLMVGRSVHQRPAPESDDPEIDAAMIAAWRDAITRATRRARRFVLRPGQVAVIDNYRMMHSPASVGPDCSLWRVSIWTTAADRVPEAVTPTRVSEPPPARSPSTGS